MSPSQASDDAGLAPSTYVRLCALLGLEPRDVPPTERPKHLPSWLIPALVATEGACVRLRRWWTAGQPDADPEHITFAGDEEIRRAAVHVLTRVPACVRYHAVSSTLIVGVGRSSVGWQQTAPQLPSPADEPLGVVCVSGHAVDDVNLHAIVAHELAHQWLISPGTARAPQQTAEEQQARAYHVTLACQLDRLQELYAGPMRAEREACALAAAWGFKGLAVDGDTQARYARRRVEDEAAQVARTAGVGPWREAAQR
jgi:hypothetical protein